MLKALAEKEPAEVAEKVASTVAGRAGETAGKHASVPSAHVTWMEAAYEEMVKEEGAAPVAVPRAVATGLRSDDVIDASAAASEDADTPGVETDAVHR